MTAPVSVIRFMIRSEFNNVDQSHDRRGRSVARTQSARSDGPRQPIFTITHTVLHRTVEWRAHAAKPQAATSEIGAPRVSASAGAGGHRLRLTPPRCGRDPSPALPSPDLPSGAMAHAPVRPVLDEGTHAELLVLVQAGERGRFIIRSPQSGSDTVSASEAPT